MSEVRTSAFMEQIILIREYSEPRVSVECGRCSLDLSPDEAEEFGKVVLASAAAARALALPVRAPEPINAPTGAGTGGASSN